MTFLLPPHRQHCHATRSQADRANDRGFRGRATQSIRRRSRDSVWIRPGVIVTNERRFAEDGVVKLGYCSTMNAQPPSSRGSLMPMPHVPEIGADIPENWYHINRQNMSYSLPEADTRKIRYQIACQTRQQWYRFSCTGFGADFW